MTQIPGRLAAHLAESALLGGDASSARVKLTEIVLTDTTVIQVPPVGVTVVVGPNNAGKSTLLRECYESMHLDFETRSTGRMMQAAPMSLEGSAADILAWLIQHVSYNESHGFTALNNEAKLNPEMIRQSLPNLWARAQAAQRLSGYLASFFVYYATTDTRLLQSNPAPVREDARQPAIHPVHTLADDPERLKRASDIAESVFGEPLILDDYSAANRLRIGKVTIPAPRRDEVDPAYRDAVLSLPELSQQGDGRRSFLGLLLPMLSARHPLVFVDEPEAFLHPPQAAALGRHLGALCAEGGLQLVLATHDRHLLTGLLEGGAPLTVVRVDRFQLGRMAKQIQPSELTELWNEPALRYTNALDGLFHRLVVLVEGDRDARFYSACPDAAHESGMVDFAGSEVLFVPCNGKGGMSKLTRALSGLGVPLVVTPDIDILANRSELKAIVQSLGADWTESLEDKHSLATSRVERISAPLQVKDIHRLVGSYDERPLTGHLADDIRRLLRASGGGWYLAKSAGIAALGTGGIGHAATELLKELDSIGLVVVSEGELESFAREIGVAKGPSWVAAAIAADAHKTEAARAHVARIARAASRAVRDGAQ